MSDRVIKTYEMVPLDRSRQVAERKLMAWVRTAFSSPFAFRPIRLIWL